MYVYEIVKSICINYETYYSQIVKCIKLKKRYLSQIVNCICPKLQNVFVQYCKMYFFKTAK